MILGECRGNYRAAVWLHCAFS